MASSDEIFFLSFFLFFCLFHFVEIFTTIREEERGREQGPPRERSKPRTHSPGRPRPKICSPDSRAHRTGTAQIWPPLWAGGPLGSCASSGVTPREGGHWVHLRRAEGAGLLGRQGLRAEGRSFREKSTFTPPATNAHSAGPGAYLLSQKPQSPGSKEL